MRNDMNKVLTERPRTGGHGKRNIYDQKMQPRETRYINGVKVDLSPKQESMRKRHMATGNPKEFSDLLGPVRRFLFSRVGQPWSKVWSEICQVLKGNSLPAHHVKDHVKRYVGGIPHTGQTFFRAEDYHNPDDGIVYVDKHGILRKSNPPFWKRKRKKKVYSHVRESDKVEYHQINGCWYRLADTPYWVDSYTTLDGVEVPGRWSSSIKKKALNRREAKKLNLMKRFSTTPPKFEP